MASQDVVAVNVFGDAALERRTRTNNAGSSAVRYTVSIAAQPILHDFSADALGKGPAEAIRELLSRLTKAITEVAKPSTLARRRNAVAGLAAGVSSYVRNYSGGRTGLKPPNQTSRLFNDSGRLTEGLAVMRNPKEDGWTINVPVNRLDPSTFAGGEPALIVVWQQLVALVPEWGGGQALIQHQELRDAVETATVDAIYVATRNANSRLRSARWQLLSSVARDLAKIVTLGG